MGPFLLKSAFSCQLLNTSCFFFSTINFFNWLLDTTHLLIERELMILSNSYQWTYCYCFTAVTSGSSRYRKEGRRKLPFSLQNVELEECSFEANAITTPLRKQPWNRGYLSMCSATSFTFLHLKALNVSQAASPQLFILQCSPPRSAFSNPILQLHPLHHPLPNQTPMLAPKLRKATPAWSKGKSTYD